MNQCFIFSFPNTPHLEKNLKLRLKLTHQSEKHFNIDYFNSNYFLGCLNRTQGCDNIYSYKLLP